MDDLISCSRDVCREAMSLLGELRRRQGDAGAHVAQSKIAIEDSRLALEILAKWERRYG